MSAIGYVHKLHGMVNPLDSFLVKKLLHSLRRHSQTDKRRPFTIQQMHSILKVLKHLVCDRYTYILMRSMFLVAFYGLFRVGEIAYSTKGSYNMVLRENLSFVYNQSQVHTLHITLKSYKHSAGKTASVPVSRQNDSRLCPVRAMLNYLRKTSHTSGFLFIHQSGSPVTTSFFRSILKSCVTACNLDPSRYTSHSFRIGGATLALDNNMSILNIQRLGRWRSSAYKKYLRPATVPLYQDP